MPILSKTHDPVQAREAGTHLDVHSELRSDGGRLHRPCHIIRGITPRAALLRPLAGISITFISMRPGLQIFETPLIGMVCLAIILANWFGGVRYRARRPRRHRGRHDRRVGIEPIRAWLRRLERRPD